ncbi:MAG: type I glyceraldehyde-3-phosphate dehydrogenase [Planctomycetota bacterium]|nr:type I glyceraldehyde-3-phosphate dehydrogenase [Planctomycetota bacterium]
MATLRLGINGFGRIGRLMFRALVEKKADIEVVGINDLTDARTLATLLKFDSVHRKFNGSVSADDKHLIVNGKKIPVMSERDPKKLPWKSLGAEIVAECSGVFRKKSDPKKGGFGDHLEAGAKKVLLSAPGKELDATIVLGVNDNMLKKEHKTFSNASCTTNCTAPTLKVIHEAFGIVKGMVTTVHAYTNDQRILDLVHEDLRRARACNNIIPTKTGMSEAIGEVIPELLGKIEGTAIRVPVPDGSIIDCSLELARKATAKDINGALEAAANGQLKGIMEYSTDPLVSSDIIGNPHSAIIDSQQTKVIEVDGKCICKVLAWYDNEWGFSNRMVELMLLAHKLGY